MSSGPQNEGRKKEDRNKMAKCKDLKAKDASECYKTESFLRFIISERDRRGLHVDEDKQRDSNYRNSQDVITKGDSLDGANKHVEWLNRKFMKSLDRVCEEFNLQKPTAHDAFVAPTGPCSYVWPVQREYAYRVAIESRIKTGKIQGDDITKWRDWKDADGNDISILDWIWRDECKWRPCKPAGALIVTGEINPPLGRFCLTPAEKRANEKKVKEEKGANGRPWNLYSREYLHKLRGAYDDFMRWRNYMEGERRTAREAYGDAMKQYKVFLGRRNGRPPSPPRERDPDRLVIKRGRDGGSRDAMRSNVVLHDDPAENRMLHEEIAQLHDTFNMVSYRCATWGASICWLHEFALMCDASGCMVWHDGEACYELPNGTRFRHLSDKISFRPSEFKDCMEHLGSAETRITVDDNGRIYKVFSKDGKDIYTMSPYAVRAYSFHGTHINPCFETMFLYYNELYNYVKPMLNKWQMDHDSVNGGAYIENASIRQFLPDDPIFGTGEFCQRHEMIPGKINGSAVHPTQVRVRRRRYEGDKGLPDSVYKLIGEINIGGGWMAWMNDTFWMKDKETDVWGELPKEDEHLRRLGYMAGDDLPSEAHDYVEFSRKLAPPAKELPPLFV